MIINFSIRDWITKKLVKNLIVAYDQIVYDINVIVTLSSILLYSSSLYNVFAKIV